MLLCPWFQMSEKLIFFVVGVPFNLFLIYFLFIIIIFYFILFFLFFYLFFIFASRGVFIVGLLYFF